MDIVLTTTLRPQLLRLTLESFSNHLLKPCRDLRLIVNIDPIGDSGCTAGQILEICRQYIPTVRHRTAERPSFSRAVQWCWQQVESDYFLHLEDDWLLRKRASIETATELLESQTDTATIRFNRNDNIDGAWPVISQGFSLNPSLMRKRFIDEALVDFDPQRDPEKQFADAGQRPWLTKWKFLCYGLPGESAYVIDTGRSWRKFNNLGKWQGQQGEITWQPRQLTRYRFAHYLIYRLQMRYWKMIASG